MAIVGGRPRVARRSNMTIVVTMREIQLREAKAGLSAAVDNATRGEPCIITRHGRRTAVLLSYEEWEKLANVPSFGRLLMAAPLDRGDLPARRRTGLRRGRGCME